MTQSTPPTHPYKVLVTKIGLDGHDRGSRVVAAFLRDAGMEVIYTPPWQEIAQVVRLAEEEDVDVIGVSSLATDHLLVPKLMQALKKRGCRRSPWSLAASCPTRTKRNSRKPVSVACSIRARSGGDRRRHRDARAGSPGDQGEGGAGMSKKAKSKSAPQSASTSATAATPLPLSDFEGARGQWRAEVTEGLGGKGNPRNRSGIEIEPIYAPTDPGRASALHARPGLPWPTAHDARHLCHDASRPHLDAATADRPRCSGGLQRAAEDHPVTWCHGAVADPVQFGLSRL